LAENSASLPESVEEETAPIVSDSYPRLRYVLSPQPTAASTLLGLSSTRFRDMRVGARIEVSPLAFKTMRTVGELINGKQDAATADPPPPRGCGLIVDYGAPRVSGQSFRVRIPSYSFSALNLLSWQAFQKHQIVDVFHAPGECDLTANVDFAYLAEAVHDLGPPLPHHLYL
jgi:NADH dehydrogenase [ubiquinone] 1 alpha subcomplex assembly factor 7